MDDDSLAGRLLLASTSLEDPNFARSVVLIGMHSEEGALGLVLNRPSSLTVGEGAPALAETIGDVDEPIYVGGPVQPTSAVLLAEFTDPALAGMLVLGRIGLPAADADLARLADGTSRRRVFAGYAGWGAGQLDGEIDRGDWISHHAEPGDVFTEDPERLWSDVLTRKGGRYALLARMPSDPSLN